MTQTPLSALSDSAPYTAHQVTVELYEYATERRRVCRMDWIVQCVCGWNETGGESFVRKIGYQHVARNRARDLRPARPFPGRRSS